MTGYREAQALSEAVYGRYRKRVLRAIIESEERLDEVFRELAQRLRERLRGSGLSEHAIHETILDAWSAVLPERQRIVAEAIREAARQGVRVSPELYRRVFGEEALAPGPFVPASASPPTPKPLLRLVRGSGGSSPATD